MVEWRKILELFGGVALGKVAKYAARYVPYDYTVAGFSAKNLIIGAAMIAGAEYGLKYGTLKDVVELGGVSIIMDEVAKVAGIEATPTVVVKAAPKAVAKPTPTIVTVK